MKKIPDQIQTHEDLELCRNTNTTIYVVSVDDLQNHIATGLITGGSPLSDFIEIDNKSYSTFDYVFLTEE